MRLLRATAAVASFTFLLLPSASALLVPSLDFLGNFVATDVFGAVDREGKEGIPDLALFMGEAKANGTEDGLFLFVDVEEGVVENASRVEVYDTSGDLSAVDQEEFLRTSRPIHKAFNNATIRLPRGGNASFVVAADAPVNFTAASPYALGMVVRPPQDLGSDAIDFAATRGLALLGSDCRFDSTLVDNSTVEEHLLLFVPGNQTRIFVSNATSNGTFTGDQFVYVVQDSAAVHVRGGAVLVPFEGNVTAEFRPADANRLESGFDLSAIDRLTGSFKTEGESNESKNLIPAEIADNLDVIAPILNGALVGKLNGTFSLGAKPVDLGDFTFLRYSHLTVDGLNSTVVTYQGSGRFLLVGDGLATTKTVAALGPLRLPALSIFLWVLAGAAIALGFVLKPFVRPEQIGAFGLIRLVGWIFHGLALLVALLLWDGEIKSLLGTSLLTIFTGGAGGQGVALAIVGAFELVPLTFAFLFFAYPVRFVVNSLLKLGGIKKARGIGKGVGDLAAWGLGAPFIPVFLNVVVGALLKGISGAF